MARIAPGDWDRVGRELSLELNEIDFDNHLDGYGWESEWGHLHSPQAKAAILLKELKLDCALNERGEKAGRLAFTEWGGHPGSGEQWVDLRDNLTSGFSPGRTMSRAAQTAFVNAEVTGFQFSFTGLRHCCRTGQCIAYRPGS